MKKSFSDPKIARAYNALVEWIDGHSARTGRDADEVLAIIDDGLRGTPVRPMLMNYINNWLPVADDTQYVYEHALDILDILAKYNVSERTKLFGWGGNETKTPKEVASSLADLRAQLIRMEGRLDKNVLDDWQRETLPDLFTQEMLMSDRRVADLVKQMLDDVKTLWEATYHWDEQGQQTYYANSLDVMGELVETLRRLPDDAFDPKKTYTGKSTIVDQKTLKAIARRAVRQVMARKTLPRSLNPLLYKASPDQIEQVGEILLIWVQKEKSLLDPIWDAIHQADLKYMDYDDDGETLAGEYLDILVPFGKDLAKRVSQLDKALNQLVRGLKLSNTDTLIADLYRWFFEEMPSDYNNSNVNASDLAQSWDSLLDDVGKIAQNLINEANNPDARNNDSDKVELARQLLEASASAIDGLRLLAKEALKQQTAIADKIGSNKIVLYVRDVENTPVYKEAIRIDDELNREVLKNVKDLIQIVISLSDYSGFLKHFDLDRSLDIEFWSMQRNKFANLESRKLTQDSLLFKSADHYLLTAEKIYEGFSSVLGKL